MISKRARRELYRALTKTFGLMHTRQDKETVIRDLSGWLGQHHGRNAKLEWNYERRLNRPNRPVDTRERLARSTYFERASDMAMNAFQEDWGLWHLKPVAYDGRRGWEPKSLGSRYMQVPIAPTYHLKVKPLGIHSAGTSILQAVQERREYDGLTVYPCRFVDLSKLTKYDASVSLCSSKTGWLAIGPLEVAVIHVDLRRAIDVVKQRTSKIAAESLLEDEDEEDAA